jgi:flagellar protein FlaF
MQMEKLNLGRQMAEKIDLTPVTDQKTNNQPPASNGQSAGGYHAYNQGLATGEDPRSTEYRLLAQVTSALKQAMDNPDNFKHRIETALWNRRIWSALRADLMHENNQLPGDLRGQLVSLSIWIDKECRKVIDGEGDIEAMININRNIMLGLRGDAGEGIDRTAEVEADIDQAEDLGEID